MHLGSDPVPVYFCSGRSFFPVSSLLVGCVLLPVPVLVLVLFPVSPLLLVSVLLPVLIHVLVTYLVLFPVPILLLVCVLLLPLVLDPEHFWFFFFHPASGFLCFHDICPCSS